MKKVKDNKVKAERTKYTGVQKCTINGEVYYRGRVKFAGKDYYTDKCSIARDAVKLREQLKADLQEQKATNQPIQTVKLKAGYLVKDILQQYHDVLDMLKPGKTFSLSTIKEKKRHMKNMIEDSYFCNIRDVQIKDLSNAHLLRLKVNFYMIRNREGVRYDIDTIRSYLNSFRDAFKDSALKNEAVARKVADLNWDILKANKAEQNSPTQLLILDNESQAQNNQIKVGEEAIRIAGKNKKMVKRVRQNDDDHWDEDNYNRFYNNVWQPLSNEIDEMIGEHKKFNLRGSDYEQATIYAVMYETGMRFGEIRAMCKDNFYTKDGIHFYFLEHAIPQGIRDFPDICIKDKELWNNVCLPKNRQRPVLVSDRLINIIIDYQIARSVLMPDDYEYKNSRFIFPDIKTSSFDKRHPKFLKKYYLTKIRIHDFRHSTAYHEKFELKRDSKVVAKILGHQDEGNLVDKIYAPSKYAENEKLLIQAAKEEEAKRKDDKIN